MNMTKMTSRKSTQVLLILTLLVLGLACGGGGSDSGISSTSSSAGSIRAKLDATKLANVRVGDTIYLYNLSTNPDVAEQEIALTQENVDDGIQVVFELETDYQMILKRKNVNFLQTIIRKEQITSAVEVGTLNIGLLNSVTTFMTHKVNLKMDEGLSSSDAIDFVLDRYFVDVEDMSGFDFNNFFTIDSPIQRTDLFYAETANRINAMSGYVDILSDIDEGLITTANAEKLQDLFNNILTSTVNNWSLAAQVADAEFDFDVTGFEAGIRDILFDNGTTNNYVMDETDLRTIFFDPAGAQDLTLFDLVVQSPDSTITGTIVGSGVDGVDVYAIEMDSDGNEVVAFQTTSDSLGNFSFDGLSDTEYKVKVSKAGFVYREKAITSTNITIEGFALTEVVDGESIVVINGDLTLGDNVSHAVTFNNDLTITGQANISGIMHPTAAGTAGQFLRIGADGNLYFDTFNTVTGNVDVSASDARDNLGLGSISTQDSSAVDFTGGNLSGITTAGVSTLSATTASIVTLSANNVDLDAGSIDNIAIGATVGSTGNFTTLDASGVTTLGTLLATGAANLTTLETSGSANLNSLIVVGASSVSTLSTTGAANLNSLETYSANINGIMLPVADGSANQVMVTQGNGHIVFQDVFSNLAGSTVSDLTITNLVSSSANLTGGYIDGVTIGGITPVTAITSTTVTVNDTLNLSGNATVGSSNTNTFRINSEVLGSTVTGNVEISGNLISSDNTYTLGVAAQPWSAIYAIDLVTTSDARLKKEVEPLNYGLQEVMRLRPVSYEWKNRANKERTIGLLAQEVEKVMDEVVSTADDEIGSRGVRYVNMVPVLIKAIQDQQKIIEAQKEQLDQQSDRLIKLETTIGK
jgi:hypothetical protein